MTVEHITPADGNIFADLGYPPAEAANLQKRAQLMIELTQILKAQFNTQTEAAETLGVTQSRISDLYRGKIGKFTIDMLVNMLIAAGRDVEITIKAAA
ncbi:MAG: transcriptional regulator [Proteobacteria bacterium]|nr:MAG: transcriptional regulator [Pseudomonadota bacterium]